MRPPSFQCQRNLGRQLRIGVMALLLSETAVAQYRLELLDMLEQYGTSTAGRVTNSGQILGVQSTYDGPFSVVTWQGKQIADITAAAGLPGSYRYLHPHTMNEAGQIVGLLDVYDYDNNACNPCSVAAHWTGSQLVELEPRRYDRSSYASGINGAGQIVGSTTRNANLQDRTTRATLWQNGSSTELGTLGGRNSYAFAINDGGAIVGYSHTTDGFSRATLWQNGLIQDLGTLGGSYSYARALNERGAIVGQARRSDGDYHAALWQNGSVTDLGAFATGPFSWSDAVAINESGAIVGTASDDEGRSLATLWSKGVISDLNTFLSSQQKAEGWLLTYASDINDKGWIVGNAYNTLTDQTRAFLLTSAVPEPGSYLMFGIGIALTLFAVRRRYSMAPGLRQLEPH